MSAEDARTVWVGNIDDKVTEEVLYELFLQAGPLQYVRQPKDKQTGRKKNFAFLCFRHECSVSYAIHLMNEMKLYGRNLRVQSRHLQELQAKGLASYSPGGIHTLDPFENEEESLIAPGPQGCHQQAPLMEQPSSLLGNFPPHILQLAQQQMAMLNAHQPVPLSSNPSLNARMRPRDDRYGSINYGRNNPHADGNPHQGYDRNRPNTGGNSHHQPYGRNNANAGGNSHHQGYGRSSHKTSGNSHHQGYGRNSPNTGGNSQQEYGRNNPNTGGNSHHQGYGRSSPNTGGNSHNQGYDRHNRGRRPMHLDNSTMQVMKARLEGSTSQNNQMSSDEQERYGRFNMDRFGSKGNDDDKRYRPNHDDHHRSNNRDYRQQPYDRHESSHSRNHDMNSSYDNHRRHGERDAPTHRSSSSDRYDRNRNSYYDSRR